jgi:small subunit ribosomal protein S9
MPAKKKQAVQYAGIGRRKSSSARVILTPGSGKIMANGIEIEKYLPSPILIMDLKQPLKLTNTAELFDVMINVNGGGYTGQAGAIRLGISRALLEASLDYRPTLKANGMLTRDARAKERKKYGLKSARRAPQFSKR